MSEGRAVRRLRAFCHFWREVRVEAKVAGAGEGAGTGAAGVVVGVGAGADIGAGAVTGCRSRGEGWEEEVGLAGS